MKKIWIIILCLINLPITNAFADGWSVFSDIFYWQPSEESAAIWATSASKPTDNTTELTPENIDFDSDFGFRLGLMYQPSSNFFDTKVYLTSYSSKTNQDIPLGDQVIYPEFFSGFLSGNFFFGANTNWEIGLNELDLEISHAFKPGHSFTLTPSIGIKGAIIDQTIKANWDAYFYTATEKVVNNFTGIGPSLGLDANWNFYKNFSLDSNFSIALLYGNWDVTDTYQRPSALLGLVSPTTINTDTNNSQLGVPMYDYFLGLKWEHHNKSQIALKVGYEMQQWDDQLKITTFEELPVHGDLTFQGLICGISIEV
jgi:hypothetical protein